MPFPTITATFFAYLRDKRGLRDATIEHYRFHLEGLAAYLTRLNLVQTRELVALTTVLSAPKHYNVTMEKPVIPYWMKL